MMTTMISWRRGQAIAIRDALGEIGSTWVDLFDTTRCYLRNRRPTYIAPQGSRRSCR